MRNTIHIDDAPDWKLAYMVGVLVGMGIEYTIEPGCPLYDTLAEFRRQEHKKIQAEKRKRLANGERNFTLISGTGKDDVKVRGANTWRITT